MILCCCWSIDQRGVQHDLGIQQLGNGTAGLSLGGKLCEFCLVRAGHLHFQGQMDRSDGKAVGYLFERHLGGGLHPLGGGGAREACTRTQAARRALIALLTGELLFHAHDRHAQKPADLYRWDVAALSGSITAVATKPVISLARFWDAQRPGLVETKKEGLVMPEQRGTNVLQINLRLPKDLHKRLIREAKRSEALSQSRNGAATSPDF
jgi:hypothetical protein